MHKILHNILKLVAILVIQCQSVNVTAQENSFDEYIDSLLVLNRMELATIRDSLYSQNPSFSSYDLVVWGDAEREYAMIVCDSVYTTYAVTKSDDRWQYTKVDPFDRELFLYKNGTAGEAADFKNNPPNKISFPDDLPKYIDGPDYRFKMVYFATYYSDNRTVDFITRTLTGSDIIPSSLSVYMVQVLSAQHHQSNIGNKNKANER